VTKVTLTQERFYAEGHFANPVSEVWQIPVALRAAGSKVSEYKILSAREQTFDMPGCAPWVFANAGGRGYYRAEYDPNAFGKMSAEMETTFSPEERIHFLGDAWAMVRAGQLKVGDYLNAMQNFQGDRNRAVIDEAIGVIPRIHDAIASPVDRPAFEAWVRKFLTPMTSDIGPVPDGGDSPELGALHTDVTNLLTSYGNDPALIAKAKSTAEEYMRDPTSVDRDLARAALRTIARAGDAALYDRYMEHIKAAKTPDEYYSYFFALTAFRDPALTKRTFEFVLSPAVRNQDMGLINGLFGDDATQAVAWDLLKFHFAELKAKEGAQIGGAGLASIAGQFCDAKMRDESQAFFAAQNIPGAERSLRNAKDRVDSCIALRSSQQGNLAEYLKK
jgi:aminopeptidase N